MFLEKVVVNKRRLHEMNGLSGRQEVCKDERLCRLCYGFFIRLTWWTG